jgi:hypothetical protein
MKSITLIQLLALPATLAFVQLNIVIREDLSDIKVAVKGEEDEIKITSADDYKEEGAGCIDSNYKWTTLDCQDRPKHQKIGQSKFADTPEASQPFTIFLDHPVNDREDGIRSVGYLNHVTPLLN